MSCKDLYRIPKNYKNSLWDFSRRINFIYLLLKSFPKFTYRYKLNFISNGKPKKILLNFNSKFWRILFYFLFGNYSSCQTVVLRRIFQHDQCWSNSNDFKVLVEAGLDTFLLLMYTCFFKFSYRYKFLIYRQCL